MRKQYIAEITIWLALLIFLSGTVFLLQHFMFVKHNTYDLTFQDIDGIIKGSPVRFLGVVVGHVRNIKVHDDSLLVQIIVTKPGVKIPDGTTAQVEFTGLAGSKSIEMNPPDGKIVSGIVTRNPIRLKDFLDSLQIYSNVLLGIENGLIKLSSQETLEILQKLKEPYDFEPIDRVLEETMEFQNRTSVIIQNLANVNETIEKILNKISGQKS